MGGGHFRALGSETRRKFVGGDDGLIWVKIWYTFVAIFVLPVETV